MNVQLLFFAALRDVTGHAELPVTLPDAVDDIAALRVWIAQRYSALSERLPCVRFAVNEVFVADEHVLVEGDLIALIPPVSGG